MPSCACLRRYGGLCQEKSLVEATPTSIASHHHINQHFASRLVCEAFLHHWSVPGLGAGKPGNDPVRHPCYCGNSWCAGTLRSEQYSHFSDQYPTYFSAYIARLTQTTKRTKCWKAGL